MFWPTVNSYKRLVDGFWAPVKPTWGFDNRTASFRVLAGSPKSTRLETRCPGSDVNSVSGDGGVHRRGARRRREEPDARHAADRGDEPGRREHCARAAHADRDDADLPPVGPSRATGSATISSITSPRRATGNGGSGSTPSPTGNASATSRSSEAYAGYRASSPFRRRFVFGAGASRQVASHLARRDTCVRSSSPTADSPRCRCSRGSSAT